MGSVYLFLIGLWTFGALYFDATWELGWRWTWPVVWLLSVVAVVIGVHPFWLAILVITALFIGVLTWWQMLKPSHDRDWDPNFAELPQFIIAGDDLTVRNIRNTHYRSLNDYDAHYETRHFRLSALQNVDLLILYWGSEKVSHPMLIFDFGDDQHLCFSIEVRYRANQGYEMLRSLYRQNEMLYLVCDERDAILRRSRFGENQDCYLYRVQTDGAERAEFLLEFIEEANAIFAQPRWYNVVTNNCTTSIYRQRSDKTKWDWRMFFNGRLDKMLYERGRLYQGLAFAELKKQSWINDRANGATEEGFSRTIRDGLPGFD